jgi:exodeoxyribonuclease-3
MKIASFNINGIKARLPRLKEWLAETKPTVACLQETKCLDEHFPQKEFEDIGYHVIFHGQKSFNGVATLITSDIDPNQITEIQRGLGIDGPKTGEGEQARYLEVQIKDTRVINIYLPNGNPLPGPKFEYKIAWMGKLRERLSAVWTSEMPSAVLGDFNIIPDDDDVWDVRAMESDALMHPDSRKAFNRLLSEGWLDSLKYHNPRGGIWTYWDYQAGAWQRDHGFRIDHILLTPELADRLVATGVDKEHRGREKASDHAPIWVTLRN